MQEYFKKYTQTFQKTKVGERELKKMTKKTVEMNINLVVHGGKLFQD